MMPTNGWSDQANCKGHTSEFYAIHSSSARRAKNKIIINAISHCESCIVSVECLKFACSVKEEYGIWASFLPEQIASLSIDNLSDDQLMNIIYFNIQSIKENANNA